ncbi:helix-turn-helix domain-containing protein [Rhizobium mongolense]|uniref:helix-turn-helix domain-containing protein n=1 Tax=Rhizobium mongolense TaxID=57676 RepID=UPI0035E4408D
MRLSVGRGSHREPRGKQDVLLRQFAGVVRLVYNLALESAGTGGGITGGRPGSA